MKRSLHIPIAPGRKIGAWVCLVAVVLLWAPLGAAAWQAHGMACCDGGMCATHGHSKPNYSQPRQATPTETPLNCGHHGGTGIANCSVSCCQENNPSFTSAVVFLLPAAAIFSQPPPALATSVKFAPTEFVQASKPLSPPPRISPSIL